MQTPTRKNRAKRDKRMYADYTRLMAIPGAMPTACEAIIMKKYGVSRSTIQEVKRRNRPQPTA